jgi:murein DD-endopeptidase MepM/ murein hydrolase activator NlpD
VAKKPKGQYQQAAVRIANEEGIPAPLFLSLIQAESGWNPNAVSPAGAIGLGQLMPGTAQGLGVNPRDPVQNLRGAAKYLASMLRRFGSPQLALSAYNSGPGGSESSGKVEGFAETQAYVKKVMSLSKQYGNFDTGGNVGSLPMGNQKGAKMKQVTQFIDAPPSLGLRANMGPLSKRAVADISARASRPILVAQPFTPQGTGKGKGKGLNGTPVFNPVGLGIPSSVHWSAGGGRDAHGSRAIGNWQSDNAVDLMMKRGSPIYAIANGVVGPNFGSLNSKDPKMAGLRMTLVGKNNEYYYAHLSGFAPGVKPGTHIKKGQLLGFSGTANGADHLHLGFKYGNPDYLLNYWSK